MNDQCIGLASPLLVIVATVALAATDPQPVLLEKLTPETKRNHEIWFRETEGENLALGKKYTLKPAANYHLCTDSQDKVQLTDGVLSKGYFWTRFITQEDCR